LVGMDYLVVGLVVDKIDRQNSVNTSRSKIHLIPLVYRHSNMGFVFDHKRFFLLSQLVVLLSEQLVLHIVHR
jgi:hypothetical protein